MNAASALGLLLIVAAIGAVLSKRRRIADLPLVPDGDAPEDEGFVCLVRPGVELPDAARRQACAYARAKGLRVLDLIAPNLDALRTTLLLDRVDPSRFRGDLVARGMSSGDALVVDRGLFARAALDAGAAETASGFLRMGAALKQFAVAETDFAIAPGLRSAAPAARELGAYYRDVLASSAGLALLVRIALQLAVLGASPILGVVSFLAYGAEPLLSSWGTALAPPDRWQFVLARYVAEARAVLGKSSDARGPAAVDESRRSYAGMMERGLSGFFEPPSTHCPLCGDPQIAHWIDARDRIQRKPGKFSLWRCAACGHVFQNPRLSLAGLDFYYRDFYDGLGASFFAAGFAAQMSLNEQRVRMVTDVAEPRRWLDVGAGHGHLCLAARQVLPGTEFEGLDLNSEVLEAERRGWIDRAHRGLFPVLSESLAAQQYDIVSMSHYLEHTLDPRQELDAAARVLRDGGLLMIEVPDPDSRIGRWFRGLWMPWFQPQHLHFVSARNLEHLLKERAFQPLRWHRGEAHITHDFTFILYYLIETIAPAPNAPWTPRNALRGAWRSLVWLVLFPLVLLGKGLDLAFAPLLRREGWSNTYRVLAQKLPPQTSTI